MAMASTLINIPDHLRTGLWGWSWNKRTWPGKKSREDGFYHVFLDQMKILISEKQDARHYLARARFLVKYGDIDNAIVDYNRAIRLNPREVQGIAERGDLYLMENREDEALHDYLIVLRKMPEEKIVHLKLAYIYLLKGNLYDAEFHYRESGCNESHPTSFKLIGDYLRLTHKKAVQMITAANKKCEIEYSEENIIQRAKAKELGYDLSGAAEDYMMLYLLFEKKEYLDSANQVKQLILDLRLNRKRLGFH
jgi:tetratricopeptide (TPR) repeat protein